MLPAGLGAPYAATLADRHSRRSVLLWSAALRTAALLGAAAAAAGAPLGVLLVFATLFTVAHTAHRPGAGGAHAAAGAHARRAGRRERLAGARSSTWGSSPAASQRG